MDIQNLLADLTRFESVTPDDAACQDYMISYLEAAGFQCQRFNSPPVANFFARYGHQAPLLVFAGHTDVVPAGDRSKWQTDPFELTCIGDMAYGRGVADMKGSLAAMMDAARRFVSQHPDFSGSLGFLITSGEEGDLYDLGTPHVMSELEKQGISIDYCIVGEPSSTLRVGDLVKIGRRGSLTGQLTLHGRQGHVAYPHLAENPIHTVSRPLMELTSREWDNGNDYFPPTSFQVTHVHAGGEAGNIIPGKLDLHFNFRFSTEQTEDGLKSAVERCFAEHGLHPEISWRLSGNPFLTARGRLLSSCIESIVSITGQEPELSTSGGTSDGRFIAPYGVEVLELGPVNATIHQVNECVSLSELNTLGDMYFEICRSIFQTR
ncbi:succinyl-diaminopimelate desuccinylase [Legionella sp. CNM-4043-24]|uniref:succinyl-diaminopimelate desuccinylase n=1 Tax=Legionella sp. CNM-4043-24 TaxID=3421646 RepID=UPI00403AAAE6